ncbi:Hypothetical predicted protein, partial [Paramuricea clavata]
GKDGRKGKIIRKLRFLDSFKFMPSSLDKLVRGVGRNVFRNLDLMSACYTNGQKDLLKQKRVYPYEYMDGFDRLGVTALPPKEKFFSKLNNESIGDMDYKRAQT